MRLRDRVVLVAGAGQTPGETIGNGRAAAIAFAREGAKLVLGDVDIERARETLVDVRAEIDDQDNALACELDVTDERSVEQSVARCIERFGRIDVLHHNVGIAGGDGPPMHLDYAAWSRMLEVNTSGLFLTIKHVLPVMREQQSGCIIAISSIAAWWTINSAVAYKASKAAMNALVQSVAVSNAKYGIRANAILPGLMDTPIAIETTRSVTGQSREEIREARNRQVPLNKRMGNAWDVANAACFLASDEASFITGVMLPVDGGQSAQIG
jgi:NAD(P)-dependent dehydrogenase (short-subunit alcohol dehydrogenase family)